MAAALIGAVSIPARGGAQDTATRAVVPSPGTRLRVVFRPPERGTTRERTLAVVGDSVRPLIPDLRVDSLIPQTLRSAPFVAICVTGQADSARLTLRLRDTTAATMIALVPGLNRIALAEAGMLLRDGDIASWSLATRSGGTLLESQIERRVVRATPTVASLTRNGIWSDALDLFVVDAIDGRPLAAERLQDFLRGAGVERCPVPPPA